MTLIKNVFFLLLLVVFVLLSSCKKYPEGPKFSLLTKKIRVWEDWVCDAYYRDGVDASSGVILSEIKCGFSTNKSAYFSNYGSYVNGNWKFQNKKTELFIQSNSASPSRTFKILKLKERSLWLEETFNGITYEYHFYSKNPIFILEELEG